MPLQNHLDELERKHQALERELRDAVAHPATDDKRLAELKRRKLHLKDELSRLTPPSRQAPKKAAEASSPSPLPPT